MPQALPVSAVVSFVREVLENNEILTDLWIIGEVSNYTRSQAGHRYFSLKDSGSVLRSVLFASKLPSLQLHDGDRVFAHGYVSIYTQRGELQFVCDFIRPEGVGLVNAKLEELKARLEAEGLFDPARKRALPRFPGRIGVVTSPTGAALQDIRNVITRRWPLAELVLSPALVQGEQAAGQIVGALRVLANQPGLDLAIVARGGGSTEDLWAFNDERVVRAIFGFPVPVVAGVGHETDETLADLVADLRAPTPSAAAMRATPDIRELWRALRVLDRQMASAARSAEASAAADVEAQLARLRNASPDARARAREVTVLLRQIEGAMERTCGSDRVRVEVAAARMAGLNPAATLRRGFAIVEKPSAKQVVSSIKSVKAGDRLTVSVADGSFWTEVS
jgi:exodeoxyribonuclease VII large subunit